MDLRDQIKQELTKRKKDRGFGDTFERLMIFTGIKRLVKWILSESARKYQNYSYLTVGYKTI
jgi:hypothetical protein